MAMNGEQPDLREFILRRLEDEDRERLEEALFSDDVLFERLVEEENDLIDEWARGTLPRDEHRLVEKTIGATPRGAERLRFARGLVARADSTQLAPVVGFRRRSAAWIPVAVAAGVATVVAGLWFSQDRRSTSGPFDADSIQATHRSQEQERVAPVPGPSDAPAVAETPAQIADAAPSAPAPARGPVVRPEAAPERSPALLSLSLAVLRSEGSEPNITLEDSRPLDVAIQLDPQDSYDTYSVSVTGPDGTVVHQEPALPRAGTSAEPGIRFRIPAEELAAGAYEVGVSADGAELGWITFRVKR